MHDRRAMDPQWGFVPPSSSPARRDRHGRPLYDFATPRPCTSHAVYRAAEARYVASRSSSPTVRVDNPLPGERRQSAR